jgi:hypothetical protein
MPDSIGIPWMLTGVLSAVLALGVRGYPAIYWPRGLGRYGNRKSVHRNRLGASCALSGMKRAGAIAGKARSVM